MYRSWNDGQAEHQGNVADAHVCAPQMTLCSIVLMETYASGYCIAFYLRQYSQNDEFVGGTPGKGCLVH